jgi:DNA-binding transcriptional regulator YhcF (GntR family)
VALEVNPQVVESVYADLEREGLLTTADGSGVFVAAPGERDRPAATWSLAAACSALLETAQRHGHSPSAVLETIERLLSKSMVC